MDFAAFFSEENLERLARWGRHHDNLDGFEVLIKIRETKGYLELRRPKAAFVAGLDAVLWAETLPWPDLS
jgi:hypothetical protein